MLELGLGRFIRLTASLLLVAPAVTIYRRVKDSRATPPAGLQETYADDLQTIGLLVDAQHSGSYERVASAILHDCRWRLSMSDSAAATIIEQAVALAGEGPLSSVSLRTAARMLSWRVNTGNLR